MPDPNQIFRDYLIDGVLNSGPNPPVMSEVRAWAADVDGASLLSRFDALADDLSARTVPDPGIRIEPPTSLGFLPRPQAVSHAGPRGVKFDRSIVDWAFDYYGDFIQAADVYVDLVSGSDGAAGTYAAPFLTVAHAVKNTTASFVKVKCNGAVAVPFQLLNTDTGAAKLKVITLLDGDRLTWRFPGPSLSGQTWTASANGSYVTTLSGQAQQSPPHHVLYAGLEGGRWLPQAKRLTKLASTGAFASNAYSYFVDFTGSNRLLYVKLNGANVESQKALLKALYYGASFADSLLLNGGKTILDGNHVFDGAGIKAGDASNSAYKASAFMRGGQIVCPPSFGFKAYGGIVGAQDVRNVLAYYDQFNYDVSPDGSKCYFCEIDTVAAGAGDVDAHGIPDAENRNASSAHGGASGIRAGCLYDETRGPVVNDTTINGQNDFTWNIGNVMRESLSGTEASIQCSGGTTGTRTMYNDRNATRESVRSIYVTGAGATAKQFGNLLHVAATADTGGALVDPYDPTAP